MSLKGESSTVFKGRIVDVKSRSTNATEGFVSFALGAEFYWGGVSGLSISELDFRLGTKSLSISAPPKTLIQTLDYIYIYICHPPHEEAFESGVSRISQESIHVRHPLCRYGQDGGIVMGRWVIYLDP